MRKVSDTRTFHVYKSSINILIIKLGYLHCHLFIVPKRENMISRSSSVVTGFSLHTNSTFSGGLISASGRSPTWKNVQQQRVYKRLRLHLWYIFSCLFFSPSPAGWPESWLLSPSTSRPTPLLPSHLYRRSLHPLQFGRSAQK